LPKKDKILSDNKKVSIDDEEAEIPDTLFNEEISEEETMIMDDKGGIHEAIVPKIK
jgi:hypothetical protein